MRDREMPIFLPRNYIVWGFLIWLIYRSYKKPEPEMISVIYFVVVCFILCEIYMTYIKSKIKILTSKLPERVNKEEKVTLRLTVYNHSFLPVPYVYIFLKDSYHIVSEQYKCLCVSLPPHGHKEFVFHLKAENSGKEVIGIDRVVVNDFLELARRKLKYQYLQEVTILPQPIILKGVEYLLHRMAISKNDNDEAKQMMITEDGEVSYELKPYVEGQSQRLIHWKLVAQRDIYMIREREQTIKLRKKRVVVVDPIITLEKEKVDGLSKYLPVGKAHKRWEIGRRKAKLRDKLVNGTTSYLLEVLKLGESILLFYHDEEGWQQVKLEVKQDLEKINEKLSGCMLEGRTSTVSRLPQLPTKGYSQKIVITSGADQRLRSMLEEMQDVKVLELQQRSMLDEETYGQYWYLTDDYQIVTNG